MSIFPYTSKYLKPMIHLNANTTNLKILFKLLDSITGNTVIPKSHNFNK